VDLETPSSGPIDPNAPPDDPTTRSDPPTPSSHRPGRYVPAVLDALIPGIGHLVAGRTKRALLFLAPVLVAIAVGVWIVLTTSMPRLVAELLASEVIWALIAIQALFLLWRLLAVGSSLFNPALPRPGRRDVIPVALVLLLVIVPQAYGGYATNAAREAADEIFVETPPVAVGPSEAPEPDPSFLDAAPSESVEPSASASASLAPSATPAVPRVTGLIIGVDSGVGRNTYLTDTMIVVSLDPVAEAVSMVSIPRDMVDVPLSDGRKFRGKINSLVSYARHHPKQFPGSDGTGFDVLMDALGTLLREPIQYYAKVDLGGFVHVVDTLGGVNVNVVRSFCDSHYSEYGYENGFSIRAGRHHLNGQQALAYARVRKPAGESDFTRAARQQEVVQGIRDAVVRGGFLNDPVGLLKAIGRTVETNVPRKKLPDLADAASSITRKDTYRAVITHPLVRGGYDNRGSIQIPDVADIRALANKLFPPSGTLPPAKYLAPVSSGSVSGSGVSSCAPAATPKPTPKPTKKPTPKPTVKPSHAPTATPGVTPVETPVPS
jgi:LCP family protein required for cell wall assembly